MTIKERDIQFLKEQDWLVVEHFDTKNTAYFITQNRVVRKKTNTYKEMITWLVQNGIPVFRFKDNYTNGKVIVKTDETYIFKSN